MNLLIVTTKKDLSPDRIIEEAEKKKIKVTKTLYSKLDLQNLKQGDFRDFDFCILRDPYNTGKDFSSYLRNILTFFKPKQILDYKTYNKYPFYEDKLFQYKLFKDIVNMPETWHFKNIEKVNIKSFPVIIKKRIGSRGKGIFILNTINEAKKFFSEKNISDYFFQEYLDNREDIRIFLINNKIIGAVKRRIRIKNVHGYKGIGVKVVEVYQPSEEIRKKAVKISQKIGSDFCGIDFVIDKNGKSYLLECNVSPQFVASERVLKINIAGKLIGFILGKIK